MLQGAVRFIRKLGTPLIVSTAVGLAVLMTSGAAHAVKANPRPFTVYQPDGSEITIRMIGDERIVFYETDDGHTILHLPDGWWVYADPISAGAEALTPSHLRAGVDELPENWPRHIRPEIDPNALSIPFDIENDGSIKELFLARGFGTSAGGNAPGWSPSMVTNPTLVIPASSKAK